MHFLSFPHRSKSYSVPWPSATPSTCDLHRTAGGHRAFPGSHYPAPAQFRQRDALALSQRCHGGRACGPLRVQVGGRGVTSRRRSHANCSTGFRGQPRRVVGHGSDERRLAPSETGSAQCRRRLRRENGASTLARDARRRRKASALGQIQAGAHLRGAIFQRNRP